MGYEIKNIDVLVLGLGNELLTDDGVGIHAVRMLGQEPPMEGVVVAQVGTAILHAQDLLEQAVAVIAIDAVQAGDKPGSIYRFDVDQARINQSVSLHDLGIVGVMQLIPQQDRPAVTILGVEPQSLDYGMDLSPAVKAVVPRVVQIVRTIATEILSRKAGCSAGLVNDNSKVSL
jgi:hydrogenase maturation protease